MKKITYEDFVLADGVKRSRQASAVSLEVAKLELNEGIFIPRGEWHLQTHPSIALSKIASRRGRAISTKTLVDGSGWMVVRVR